MIRKSNDTNVLYLDDVTTVEHLLPLLEKLPNLGNWEVWVSCDLDPDDERSRSFWAKAPGPIVVVRRWEQKFDWFTSKLLSYLHPRAPRTHAALCKLISCLSAKARSLRQGTRYICGFGGPSTFMFQVALGLGVPGIQIPHGFNIFRDILITDEAAAGAWRELSFSNRNLFSLIIVQSPNLASWLHTFGVSKEKMRVLGSPRFSLEWSLELDAEVRRDAQRKQTEIDVLFLLPNWNYRVQWEDLKAVVEMLAGAPLAVTIGTHPRVPKVGPGVDFFSNLKHLKLDGLEISTDPAYRLIPFSKVVLAAGTSVGLHALNTERAFLNLSFLTSNRTIFDFVDGINVLSLDELRGVLDTICAGRFQTTPNKLDLDLLRHQYIDKGKSLEELVDSYIREIRNVKKR